MIHYSCESFEDRPDGLSPRITSIAVLDLATYQVSSFSIHLHAERSGITVAKIHENYNQLELGMLEEYFAHLNRFQDRNYLHWNMRDVGYGFQAIQHRFITLGGKKDHVYVVDNTKKLDLAIAFKQMFGDDYVDHPRMEGVFSKNDMTPKHFLSGPQEAEAFDNGEYFKLHQSTLGKVHAFADLVRLANDGKLKTNATWYDLHGGKIREVIGWALTHPVWTGVGGLIGIAGITLAIWAANR